MVQAASVNHDKKVTKKITHPCARKSAAQLNKRAAPYLKSIQSHAKKYGVDSDLVKSVITIESCYRKKARSHKGAQGLMQLIPATASRFGIKNAYDSHQNILGGTRYLAWLSKRFGGDLSKVLAGYNAGEGKVDRYNGIPPYRETRNYVHDVLAVYKKFKQQGKAQIAAQATKNMTPQQRKQAQLRQQHQQKIQQQRLAQQRRQQQQRSRQQQQRSAHQQRLAQANQQLKPKPGTVVVIGKPGKPVYVNKPQTQMIVGKPPLSAAALKRQQQQRAAARPAPVLLTLLNNR